MNTYKIINEFLAGIMIMIFHMFVGQFVNRTSMVFIVAMYIFVLVMIRLTGMPIDEKTGEIKEPEVEFNDLGDKFGF